MGNVSYTDSSGIDLSRGKGMRIPAGLSETAFFYIYIFFFSFYGMKGLGKMNTEEIINIYCPVPHDCEIVLLCPNAVATHEH